jgi:hypothetical protein
VEATEILSALAVEEAHNLSAMFSLDLYELIVYFLVGSKPMDK